MHLVTFDIDDTLILTQGFDDSCFIRALSETTRSRSINSDWDSYPQVTEPGIAAQVLGDAFGRPASPEEMDEAEARYQTAITEAIQAKPDSLVPMPGAVELLDQLRHDGEIAVACATGAWRSSSLLRVKAAGINIDGFPLASGNDNPCKTGIVIAAKAKAQKQWRVDEFESHTHVGDRLSDYEAAQAMASKFLAIGAKKGKTEAFISVGVEPILKDLCETERIIQIFKQL
jgi:phosphoglycolate phosphatase-like HAD superfamily hydrolase